MKHNFFQKIVSKICDFAQITTTCSALKKARFSARGESEIRQKLTKVSWFSTKSKAKSLILHNFALKLTQKGPKKTKDPWNLCERSEREICDFPVTILVPRTS